MMYLMLRYYTKDRATRLNRLRYARAARTIDEGIVGGKENADGGTVNAKRAACRSRQVSRKLHTRQGASDGCADGDETARIRHRHQNHPRPTFHQPTAAKVQTGTECRALSAKTISRQATGRATDEPTDQPSQNCRGHIATECIICECGGSRRRSGRLGGSRVGTGRGEH